MSLKLSILLGFTAVCCVLGLQAKEKLNILFIFAYDPSYETVNAHSNKEIHTPNLDTYAESGVSFYNAYNMGGSLICIRKKKSKFR